MVDAPVALISSILVTLRALASSLQDIMLDTPQHIASSPWCSISTRFTPSTWLINSRGSSVIPICLPNLQGSWYVTVVSSVLNDMSKLFSSRYSVVCMTLIPSSS